MYCILALRNAPPEADITHSGYGYYYVLVKRVMWLTREHLAGRVLRKSEPAADRVSGERWLAPQISKR